MADITADIVASTVRVRTAGNARLVTFRVATVADGDTVDVNDLPEGIEYAIAVIEDADAVAADVCNVASVSGKTITFQVTGAANDVRVEAHGRAANK